MRVFMVLLILVGLVTTSTFAVRANKTTVKEPVYYQSVEDY